MTQSLRRSLQVPKYCKSSPLESSYVDFLDANFDTCYGSTTMGIINGKRTSEPPRLQSSTVAFERRAVVEPTTATSYVEGHQRDFPLETSTDDSHLDSNMLSNEDSLDSGLGLDIQDESTFFSDFGTPSSNFKHPSISLFTLDSVVAKSHIDNLHCGEPASVCNLSNINSRAGTPLIYRNKTQNQIKKLSASRLVTGVNSLDINPQSDCLPRHDHGNRTKRHLRSSVGPHSPLVCDSQANAVIKSALDRVSENPDLTSDGSKTCCLPTIPGKHEDLKSIAPETLAKIVNQEYDHVVEQCVIVDCRYPYEYEGGHIQGSKNYYTRECIIENLLKNPLQTSSSDKRSILVFLCEFSSERAPIMSRFLRSVDRHANKESYPKLFYPEMYLLHDGYKEFFISQKNLCIPQTYVQMSDGDYKEDLRKIRAKSKFRSGKMNASCLRMTLKF